MKKKSDLKYIGRQTKLALNNFPFSYSQAHIEIVYAMADIKEAAAFAHKKAHEIDSVIADAIINACQEVKSGKFDDQFQLPGLQGGAGTSIHMNVNEVIATRSTEILKNKKIVSANNQVNKSQSTNDVGPSALKIVTIRLIDTLLKTLDEAGLIFEKKGLEFHGIAKLGRTHLQDAVPTTLGEEFLSYAASIRRGRKRLEQTRSYMFDLNLGGTAIGNMVNASLPYRTVVYKKLSEITGFSLKPAKNLMSQTSSQTDFVAVSQALTAIMIDFSKIANDLRLLGSGPSGGLGEIRIKEMQPGSSIMPGKANPILPETVNQTYFLISGNNLTIEHAAQASQLELGIMFPILADKLVSSLKISSEVIHEFATKCVAEIAVREDRCHELLTQSTAFATLLSPKLGYEAVSALVKKSQYNGESFRKMLEDSEIQASSVG